MNNQLFHITNHRR